MQTKRQIQQLLASAGIFPNKRLGQNFLIDLNLMRLLIDSANIGGSDCVLEVGCGTGSLTEAIAEKASKVIAVEFDRKLAEIAKRQLAGAENVEIVNTDILESKNTISPIVAGAIEQARKKYSGRLMLVANLPYNCACPVMVNLIAGPVIADDMYVTVQKEVADRMTAAPGGSDYGVLSILLAAAGKVKIMRVLGPTVFWPAPQVDSAMVSFVRDEEKISRIRDMKLFSEVVNLFMGHRRKMVKACSKLAKGKLAEIKNWQEIFEKCAIDPHNRPEQLSPEDYIAIANSCHWRLKEGAISLKLLYNRSGKDARTVNWGDVNIRLRNRVKPKVDEGFLEKIFSISELSKYKSDRELLLILDDKDGFGCGPKKRGVTYPSIVFDTKDFPSGYEPSKNVTTYREIETCCKDMDAIDLQQKYKWDAVVYIPKITAEKWKDFKAYFVFVLGHELEHVKIIREKLDFHICASWLYQYNANIFKEGGHDYKSMKTWDFPWEQHCNKEGKRLAQDFCGKEEFDQCLEDLMQRTDETQEYKEFLGFILRELEGQPCRINIWESVLREIRIYYQGLEEATHRVYAKHKLQGVEPTKHFDLEKFLPLA